MWYCYYFYTVHCTVELLATMDPAYCTLSYYGPGVVLYSLLLWTLRTVLLVTVDPAYFKLSYYGPRVLYS